ncbi:MAG: DUF4105 domain-containing protein [Geminicoccaceae bacterium]|nr:DUF4105 domain-containing protein [Geminicoccaceae bacterium]
MAIGGVVLLARGAAYRASVIFGALAASLLFWWSRIEPSNERVWAPEVARLAAIRVDGDIVTVENLRNFRWLDGTRFEERWETRRVALSALDSVDLIAVYWMGDAIAHVIASFGFGAERIAISIEIRREADEAYDAIAGFFRRFELVYVVGDERDLLGGRALRDPVEDLYLYRVRTSPERMRRLFLDYAVAINDLHHVPRWYNTLTTNCTTAVLSHARAYGEGLPLTWKVLLSGYFPDYVHERGGLAADLPMSELRAKSRINEAARAALDSPDFSARIRAGLPAMAVGGGGSSRPRTGSVGDR